MDVFDRIEQDHEVFRRRFDEMQEAIRDGDKPRSMELFHDQYVLLIAHHETEEEVLFKRMEERPEARPSTEEAWEEHEAINHFLHYLDGADKDVRWEAKIKVLDEITRHHLDEEEDQVFSEGRKLLDERLREQLVEEFERVERQWSSKLEQDQAA